MPESMSFTFVAAYTPSFDFGTGSARRLHAEGRAAALAVRARAMIWSFLALASAIFASSSYRGEHASLGAGGRYCAEASGAGRVSTRGCLSLCVLGPWLCFCVSTRGYEGQ